MDNNNSLGLPPGSVRAILALGLAGAVIYLCIIDKIPAERLLTIFGMITAFYFGASKKGQQ